MDKLVLTVPEVAKVLDLSTATVYVMVRNNEIPYKKLRGKIVFHRETIEKWLATPTA
ncbi:helix-turn-helix domain-containing protein [Lysinibacillus sp. G4S2]|uniref:helix-turn-helix domain-containing protein n=1 Tax=Lysinibacillus sp. G4S2 TaxID=3055859 RepID=UPI0025A2359B|nr:helix-turn-helix domain-containing protein [Lysinibacillus sp. G4S2]MDM5246199.1 helix-turn-helix domain-containing protein [Lysinibacillus sp. G4S2]